MDKLQVDKEFQKTETLWSNEHFIEHNEKLRIFFENQQFCDVTLISSDDKYTVKAHRMFLASVSKYFLAMFGGSLAESNAKEVKLTQIDGDSLKLILNFIYKGIIEVTAEKVESVLMGSHILGLTALEKLCCYYIKKSIDVSNCLGIADLAQRHNFNELYEAASVCACENFPSLRYADEFKLLSCDQLCALIARDDLRSSSEYDIFRSVMKWINYKKDDRTQFLQKLLSYVRFPLLSPSIIGKIIEKTGESLETLRIVNKAFTWHTVSSWRSTIFPREQSKIRNFKDVIVAINRSNSVDTDMRVGLYYSGLNEWIYTKWPGKSNWSNHVKFTILKNKLIIASDSKADNQFTNKIDCLNLETLEWTDFPDLNMTNQSKRRMITSNDVVYVLSDSCLNTIEEPFTKWKSFTFNPPMPFVQRQRVHAINTFAVYEGLIYYNDWEGEHYNSYNPVDGCHNKQIERVEKGHVIGLHIIKHLGSDYLIEIMSSTAVAYDLKTNRNILQNKITFDRSCVKTALHGKDIILYGANQLYEYNMFMDKMTALPSLVKHIDHVDILLSDSNSGLQESNKVFLFADYLKSFFI